MLPFVRRAARFAVLPASTAIVLLLIVSPATADPFTPGNILLTFNNEVVEYTRGGERVQTIPIPLLSSYYGRNVVVDETRRLQVLNGLSTPFLSTWEPSTGAWTHLAVPGWNLRGTGGIGTVGPYVFVPDHAVNETPLTQGIIRIDTRDGSYRRFSQDIGFNDLAVGLDGLVYALTFGPSDELDRIRVYDPITLSLLRTIRLAHWVIYIAVDRAGHVFGADYTTIYRFDGGTGAILDSLTPLVFLISLTDIDVSADGAVAAHSAHGSGVILTDEALDAFQSFASGAWTGAFLSFVSCLPADLDCDDLPDAEEIPAGTRPDQADTDGDGLIDGHEVHFYASNPLVPDTDGDGLGDGEEAHVHHSDPTRTDTDGDGLTDFEEVRTYASDPRLADTDGDTLTDREEALQYHSDPRLTDTDGDGLQDGEEVHTWGTDPASADPDKDGLADPEELQARTDPFDADTDDDGLSDYEEVRIWLTNPISRSIPYVLPGSITASSGGIAQITLVTEILFLSADRSYVIGFPGDGTSEPGVPERGVWFRSQRGLLFYQQNLFDYLETVADAVRPQLGPVTIILRANSRSALISERSGILSVRGTANFNFLRGSNASPVGLLVSDRVSGPFSEIPTPEPTSAENDPGASFAPAVGTAAPAAAPVASSAWLVTGTVATRTGRTTETRAISGSLLLDSDQTFALDLGEVETPMRGMWFQDRKSMLLYPQNLLDQTLALERALSARTGEPVRADLLQVRDTATSDSRTGVLLLTIEHRHGATLARSGQLIAVTSTWKLTATPAP